MRRHNSGKFVYNHRAITVRRIRRKLGSNPVEYMEEIDMTKKIFALAIALTVLGAFVAGCSQPAAEGEKAPAEGAATAGAEGAKTE